MRSRGRRGQSQQWVDPKLALRTWFLYCNCLGRLFGNWQLTGSPLHWCTELAILNMGFEYFSYPQVFRNKRGFWTVVVKMTILGGVGDGWIRDLLGLEVQCQWLVGFWALAMGRILCLSESKSSFIISYWGGRQGCWNLTVWLGEAWKKSLRSDWPIAFPFQLGSGSVPELEERRIANSRMLTLRGELLRISREGNVPLE